MATMNDDAKATATVIGKAKINSPTEPFNKIIGIKEAIMVIVAAKTGITKSLALRHAAVQRSMPSSNNST